MSNLLKCLKICNFYDLYIKAKLSFLKSLKYNDLSMYIFKTICTEIDNSTKKTKSFKKDIELLQSRFNLGTEELLASTSKLINSLKEPFRDRDGIMESISTCLYNIKNKLFKKMLNDILRPDFLTDYIQQMHEIID
jgi:hypothetical protein